MIADVNGRQQAGRRCGITIEDSQERVARVTKVLVGYSVRAEVNRLLLVMNTGSVISCRFSETDVLQINYEDFDYDHHCNKSAC